MPRRVAKAGSADGRGVYGFMRDLILEGKVAKWVNNSGRYIVRDWSRALDCYADYKAKKNPLFKRTNQSRGKASNRLRAALLNAYKEDGAKEYMESKKVNEKNQVVERQFQMPSSVFESLFRNTELSDSGEEQDEQERKRLHLSEGAVEVQVSPESSSDAGFEETMDLSCEPSEPIHSASVGCFLNNPSLCDSSNFESEGPGTQFSDSDFETQMFDQVAVESALEEICSETERVSLLMGEVHEICPPSGSVKGQYPFNISLTEPLSDDITSGMAEFEGVEIVALKKMNPYTFSGFVPASTQPGDVGVKVTSQYGECLGRTCFRYVDDMEEMAKQLVHDHAKTAKFFAILSQVHGVIGTDSGIAQVLDPLNLESQGDFDSSIQAKQKQAVKILELLVYKAAQTGANQFIEMIFSTSAQQIVFDSYKDRTPLPEDVARANGHCNLAQYLQDITMRLTKEVDDQPKAIDWLELLKAVQNQVSVSQDKESKEETTPVESDGNSSDYFADDETSSCGSFEYEDAFTSNPEGKDEAEKDFHTGKSKERLLKDPPCSFIPKPQDNEKQNGPSFLRARGIQLVGVTESSVYRIHSHTISDGVVSRDRHCQVMGLFEMMMILYFKQGLVSTAAAQKGAKQFIEMIFSTLAQRIVFDPYKDRTPLPEDVARANGHCNLAQYHLQNITMSRRLTKEVDDLPKAIDWLELLEEVQILLSGYKKQNGSSFLGNIHDDVNEPFWFGDSFTVNAVAQRRAERLIVMIHNAATEPIIILPFFISGIRCYRSFVLDRARGTPPKCTKYRGVSRYESKEEKRALMTENVVVSASTCRLKRPGDLVLSPLKADERQLNQQLVIFEKPIGDESVHSPSTLLPSCSVLNKSSQSSCGASLHGLFSGNVSWKNESNMKEMKVLNIQLSSLCATLVRWMVSCAAASQDKESKEETTPAESDDNSSDYFAIINAETSSCGSFERDDEFTSNREGKDTAEKDAPTGVSKERLLEDPPYSSIPDVNHLEDSKPPDEKQSGSSYRGFVLPGDLYFNLVLPSIKKTPLIDLNFNRVLSSIKKTPLIGWIDNSPGFSFGICLSIAEMKAIARKVCGRCCSIVEMKEIAREIFGTVHITVGNSAQFLGGSPSKWINCRELSRYESKQEKRVLMAENVVVSASTCRLKRPGYLVLSPLEADERQLNQEQVIFERSIGDEPVQLPVTLLPNCSVLNKSRPQPDNSASLHDLSSGNVSWKNESNIKELKMERVRSWLCCNPNSEEFPSAEAAIQDKESKEETTPAESDDNSSDYFAIINAETSSCGSFEHDDEFTSNPEGKDTAEKGGTSSKRTKCRSVSGIKEERKRLLMTENAVISESSCRLKRPGCSRLPKVHERHLNQELGIFEKSIGDESIHSPSTLSPSCSVFNKSQPQPDTSSSLHDLSSGNVSWEKESKIKELKMARVRSWLSCNRNSEEFPSAEGFES